MRETYINPGNWWHHSWVPQPEGLPYGKEEVGEWDRDWGKQQEWSQLEEIIPKEKKSSLEKKESGTSVWLMQGLPIEPVCRQKFKAISFIPWSWIGLKALAKVNAWEGQLRGDLGKEIAGPIWGLVGGCN